MTESDSVESEIAGTRRDPPAAARRGIAEAARGALLIGASLMAMNAFNYVFTVLAARRLGPPDFGAFAALMGLVLVVNVVAIGIQAAAARRVASSPARSGTTVRTVRRASWQAGVVLGFLCLAGTPLTSAVLGLPDWSAAALLAPTALLLTVIGGQQGLLQGLEKWGTLGLIYLLFGTGRLILGALALWLAPTSTGAMAGVALGAALTAVAGGTLSRRLLVGTASAPEPSPRARAAFRGEAASASTMFLAFFALSSVDVIVARALLPAHDSGLYAAGLIVTKAVLFLPQFVSVVAFPRLARGGSTHVHRWGLALTLAIGGAISATVALVPAQALSLAGGSAYAPVTGRLWEFTTLGALLAGTQLLLTTALARRHLSSAWVLWVALALVVVLGWLAGSWSALLDGVLVVNALVLMA